MAAGAATLRLLDARPLRRARGDRAPRWRPGSATPRPRPGATVAIARVGSLLTVFFRRRRPGTRRGGLHRRPRRLRPRSSGRCSTPASSCRPRSSRPGSSRSPTATPSVDETLAAAADGVRGHEAGRRPRPRRRARRPPRRRPARRPLPARLPARAGRRDAGLVHAPGRPRAARVPRRSASGPRSSRSPATPALCAEVTLQPVRRLGVDAAILFADITTPFAGLGVDFDIVRGRRARSSSAPIRTAGRRRPPPPLRARRRRSAPLLEAIRLIRAASPVPLIGFAGAPFTLACYLVEGGPSRDFLRTKTLHARRARGLGRAHGRASSR